MFGPTPIYLSLLISVTLLILVIIDSIKYRSLVNRIEQLELDSLTIDRDTDHVLASNLDSRVTSLEEAYAELAENHRDEFDKLSKEYAHIDQFLSTTFGNTGTSEN